MTACDDGLRREVAPVIGQTVGQGQLVLVGHGPIHRHEVDGRDAKVEIIVGDVEGHAMLAFEPLQDPVKNRPAVLTPARCIRL